MQKSWIGMHLRYGMSVLAVLFIITGLTAALKGYNTDRMSKAGRWEADFSKEKKAGNETPEKKEPEKTEKENQETAKKEQKTKKVQKNSKIRVLLKTDGYQGTAHPSVSLSSASGLVVSYGKKKKEWAKDSPLVIEPDDRRLKKGKLRIQAKKGRITVDSLNRGYGTPSYEGVIELRTTAEGIVVINELPVEKYLCGVVPSEMPDSYEPEALKAQAVCARSYAYRQMEEYGYPEYKVHVDDSTAYQVYGNSAPADSTKKAVKETEGEAVWYQGKIVTTFYYSTSCGKTTDVECWGTKPGGANGYLKSVEVKGEEGDYERELPWYRWKARVPVQTMSDLIGLNTGKDVGTLKSLKITGTGSGGIALKIKASGDKGTVTVKTENKIRRALGGAGYVIKRQDGVEVDSSELLPSAFITIKKSGDAFVIKGGGFGHGIGMSQNGANEMAKCGKDYREILTLFYQGVTVE
ncbi:SpoIID/LytB domain-containing protein [Lachnospiraceae bacterium 48-42]